MAKKKESTGDKILKILGIIGIILAIIGISLLLYRILRGF
ncbi:MAG: LPXTG cell wall anchor domain-containing protein [Nanoarchaeota archaeon]|nr:LPXTG cell wall anchor domain-containing protein [Nanoarchaeota archaeon]